MIISSKNGKDNKVHIYVDDEYITTVNAEFWYMRNIKNGDEITQQELSELLDEFLFNKTYNRALNLLSIREHSRKELIDKLTKQVDKEIANEVADKLEELNLLNDENYAGKLASELKRRKGMSRFGILQELIRKGISKETAENVANEIDTDDKVCIIELLNTKFQRKDLSDEKELRRTINSLLRLGYQYNDIRSVLNEFSFNSEE